MTDSVLPENIVKILSNYHGNQAFITNMTRILMSGSLSGTGKMLILPVDQGFEHGPDASFANNPDAYDPMYHYNMAVEGGFNAYAAPIGMLESCAQHSHKMPMILKINSSSKLFPGEPVQAITSTVSDACRLGCVGVGMTIYPGSSRFKEIIESLVPIISKAKRKGLVVVIWAYPRGAGLNGESETSEAIISYSAHLACLLGADIVKVKPPTINSNGGVIGDDSQALLKAVQNIKRSCFNGNRLLLLSGGKMTSDSELFAQIKTIADAGADGSIVGRNIFQRDKKSALSLAQDLINCYK